MISVDREKFAERYRAWSTEDLLRAVAVEADGYTEEARELIGEELSRRDCLAPQRQEILQSMKKESGEEAAKLRGVKGLLLFMVFVIAANSVVALVAAYFHLWSALWLLSAICGLLGFYGLLVCGLLMSRSPRAPRHAETFILLTMSISMAEFFYFYFVARQGLPLLPLGTLASGALWLSYLSVSKRVRATYGTKP